MNAWRLDFRLTDPPWHPLLSRSGYAGGIDYLCVRQTAQGIELALCGHGWLGEVPSDWFDDDGKPVPEHRDADGSLLLPPCWNGQAVTGLEDGMFVGELMSDDERTILIDDRADSLASALDELDWDKADLRQLQTMIRDLGTKARQTEVPNRPGAD